MHFGGDTGYNHNNDGQTGSSKESEMLDPALRRSKNLILGKIKKGEEQDELGRMGKNTDYFRLAPSSNFSGLLDTFINLYGDRPRSLNIMLPYGTVDQNFDESFEEYAKYSKGTTRGYLRRKCTGKKIILQLSEQTTEYNHAEVDCIAPSCGCKRVARLTFYLTEFLAMGYSLPFLLETRSHNDMANIFSALEQAQAFIEMLLPGRSLAGARFILERYEEEILTPAFVKGQKEAIPGKLATRSEWLVGLKPDPQWVQKLMRESHQLRHQLEAGGEVFGSNFFMENSAIATLPPDIPLTRATLGRKQPYNDSIVTPSISITPAVEVVSVQKLADNISRIDTIQQIMEIKSMTANGLFNFMYPDRKTEDLSPEECTYFIHELLTFWGTKQTDLDGASIFGGADDARGCLQGLGDLEDQQLAIAWKELVEKFRTKV
jgi:hypothetical protein